MGRKKNRNREEDSKEPTHQGGRPLLWKNILKYTSACAAGVVVASLFWYFQMNATIGAIADQVAPLRPSDNTYQFIDPLLGYNLPDNIKAIDEYTPMQTDVNNLISQEQSAGTAPAEYGVYFRDLSSGRWMGVNEDTAFAPGSLMKVVLMIAYYEEAESNPSILDQKLTYTAATADELNGIPFETPSNLQVGQTYTVEQLIESMIESSDNGAKNALLDNIDSSALSNIMTDLGLPYTDLTENYQDYAITPKEYSVILRVLYNATYLDRDYSEKALEIMSHAEYNQGLVAGVPSGTAVAQKFGEAVTSTPGFSAPTVTLSNCGVVYYPDHPYLLCVMTQGTDLANLTSTISSISKLVWTDVGNYVQQGN